MGVYPKRVQDIKKKPEKMLQFLGNESQVVGQDSSALIHFRQAAPQEQIGSSHFPAALGKCSAHDLQQPSLRPCEIFAVWIRSMQGKIERTLVLVHIGQPSGWYRSFN
ncbi:hypothetical protein CDAR_444191 [Caerostris darwini]|uniref:Uncharacterized protein n=1 Tax=Caerostris darwini TaxID=1538125 RepID=A0AAV4X8C4_9ARAC|nr:hypothetical protein CDAR_444191 [Caerostris darwini]